MRLGPTGVAAPDWAEVDEIVRDAYRQVAPKRLVAQLEG